MNIGVSLSPFLGDSTSPAKRVAACAPIATSSRTRRNSGGGTRHMVRYVSRKGATFVRSRPAPLDHRQSDADGRSLGAFQRLERSGWVLHDRLTLQPTVDRRVRSCHRKPTGVPLDSVTPACQVRAQSEGRRGLQMSSARTASPMYTSSM
jgi:hypothetical protein